jgi:hypothetical protein
MADIDEIIKEVDQDSHARVMAHPAPRQARQVVSRRKQWIETSCMPVRCRHRRPVPVGLCFNCLRPNHVVVDCPSTSRRLRCHLEGHQARAGKQRRSADATGSPQRSRPSS